MKVLVLKDQLADDYSLLLSILKGKRRITISALVMKAKKVNGNIVIARPKDFVKHIQDFKRDYGLMSDRTSKEYKASQRVKKHVEKFIKTQKGEQLTLLP